LRAFTVTLWLKKGVANEWCIGPRHIVNLKSKVGLNARSLFKMIYLKSPKSSEFAIFEITVVGHMYVTVFNFEE